MIILTMTQRHGAMVLLVASTVCLGSGRARDEWWYERLACGMLGVVCGGEGGGSRSVYLS